MAMAETSETESRDKQSNRLLKFLTEVEKRVECMREQAIAVHRERESLLELLQDLQDGSNSTELSTADQEDIDCNTERLIIRCLTVDVCVSTPRDESQEDAFKTLSRIVDELTVEVKNDPKKHQVTVESYLNACLPEPKSASINHRFQDKLLGCTADDQKRFRKKLQCMLEDIEELDVCNGDENEAADGGS